MNKKYMHRIETLPEEREYIEEKILEIKNIYNTRILGLIHKNNISLIDTLMITNHGGINHYYTRLNINHNEFNKELISVFDKTIYGVGYIGSDIDVNQNLLAFRYWKSLLHYTKQSKNKYTICPSFKNFTLFCQWFYTNYFSIGEDMLLVCDLKNIKCKHFDHNTSCFINRRLYYFLKARDTGTSSAPNGCYRLHGNNYCWSAQYLKYDTRKSICIGTYKNKETAFMNYKTVKEREIKKIVSNLLRYSTIKNNPIAYEIYNKYCYNWDVLEYYDRFHVGL